MLHMWKTKIQKHISNKVIIIVIISKKCSKHWQLSCFTIYIYDNQFS